MEPSISLWNIVLEKARHIADISVQIMHKLISLWNDTFGLKSDQILLLTGLIIAIYTYLTLKLWKESATQTKLIETPYLTLHFDKNNNKFILKNIGKGIATKIAIESYKILMTDILKEFEIKFNNIEVLAHNEEKSTEYKIYENGKEISDDESREFAVHFFPLIPSSISDKKKNVIFRMTYKNIFGKHFYFDILVAENEYRIKRFGRHGWIPKLQRGTLLKLQSLKVRTTVWFKRKINKFKGKGFF